MTFPAAVTRLAFLVCLAVFLLSFVGGTSSRTFAFSNALLSFATALFFLVPMVAGKGLRVVFDFGFGVFMSWMVFSLLHNSILECRISPDSVETLYLFAAVAYATILLVLALSLKQSKRLRRFSKISDPLHGG